MSSGSTSRGGRSRSRSASGSGSGSGCESRSGGRNRSESQSRNLPLVVQWKKIQTASRQRKIFRSKLTSNQFKIIERHQLHSQHSETKNTFNDSRFRDSGLVQVVFFLFALHSAFPGNSSLIRFEDSFLLCVSFCLKPDLFFLANAQSHKVTSEASLEDQLRETRYRYWRKQNLENVNKKQFAWLKQTQTVEQVEEKKAEEMKEKENSSDDSLLDSFFSGSASCGRDKFVIRSINFTFATIDE